MVGIHLRKRKNCPNIGVHFFDNPVLGNIIFSLNGEHHLLLKVLHFRVDKRNYKRQN